MQVRTYPEGRMETFGATRWEVTWWTLRPDAAGKEELDPDSDIISRYAAYRTKDDAVRGAQLVAKSSDNPYGCAMVQEQRVDWFVEEDRVAEWSDVGSPEEVAA